MNVNLVIIWVRVCFFSVKFYINPTFTFADVHKTGDGVGSFGGSEETGVESQLLCRGEGLVDGEHVVVRFHRVLGPGSAVSVRG